MFVWMTQTIKISFFILKSILVYQRKLIDLEAQLTETIGELDKSRHLLITQVKINDDYKKEVILIQTKMEENKAEYDAKILEYAQLLDLRAARIKVSYFKLLKDSHFHIWIVLFGNIKFFAILFLKICN